MAETTRIIPFGDEAIAEAARLIGEGWPVAVATETVYGLAADATNPEAVARIYEAKGRPSFNPLIVHVPDFAAAERIGEFSAEARALAAEHWPGPLTIVVPLREDSGIASIVTAGLSTIALRVPAHPAMQALLRGHRDAACGALGQCERYDQPDAGGACVEKPRRSDPLDRRRRAHPTRPGINNRCRNRRDPPPSAARTDRHSGGGRG